jgi:hypothetical protein
MANSSKNRGDRAERKLAERLAALHKPRQAQIQAGHAGCAFASSFVRFRGGQWRAVLTLEQWSAIITRSSSEDSHSASLQRHRPDAATRPRL